jgi:hypothetical protein
MINGTEVYLEIGQKRVFAGAIDWPGWCRIGRDEESALQALVDYGLRYGRALQSAGLEFHPPASPAALTVVERLEGNATTDFGAPDAVPSADAQPTGEGDLRRFQALLQSCWGALDEAAQAAAGKELRKGPRGGGRDLEGVIRHVMGAEAGYLSRLARKHAKKEGEGLPEELARLRQAVLEAVASVARGELPERGPRGGAYWKPRYFIRRAAWHVLDHAWEIEDRIIAKGDEST